MEQERFSYVTVLTNQRYLPGVWALYHALKDVESRYKLTVLAPESRAGELTPALEQMGVRVETAPDLELPPELLEKAGKDHYWNETFFKLRAAGLTQFEKVVLVDSDMLVLRNIDHLFERPSMTAAAAGKSTCPQWIQLNSGLLVLETSKELEDKLLALIGPTVERRLAEGLPAGDQDVFHSYCPDWPEREELHLPESYNLLRGNAGTVCRRYLQQGYGEVAILHFIGARKPWEYTAVNYVKMLYHGVSQGNFAEFRAFLRYRGYLKEYR